MKLIIDCEAMFENSSAMVVKVTPNNHHHVHL